MTELAVYVLVGDSVDDSPISLVFENTYWAPVVLCITSIVAQISRLVRQQNKELLIDWIQYKSVEEAMCIYYSPSQGKKKIYF